MVGMCIVITIFVIIVGNRSKLAAFEFSIYPGSPIPIGAVHSNSTRVGFCQYLIDDEVTKILDCELVLHKIHEIWNLIF